VNEEFERMWKELSWCNLKHYPGICLEGARKDEERGRREGENSESAV
jgi:hypothetical protein